MYFRFNSLLPLLCYITLLWHSPQLAAQFVCNDLNFQLTGAQMFHCQTDVVNPNSPNFNLISAVNISGGTFSGNGMQGNIFYPALAQVGANAITYTVINDNGDVCTDTQTIYVDAVSIMPEITATDSLFCSSDPPLALSGNLDGNPNATWLIDNQVQVGGVLDPLLLNSGEHIVTLFYLEPSNGCVADDTLQIEIFEPAATFITADFERHGEDCDVSLADTLFFTGGIIPEGLELEWILPPQGTIISQTDSIAIVSWSEAGNYEVQLNLTQHPCYEGLTTAQFIVKNDLSVDAGENMVLSQMQDIVLDPVVTGNNSANWVYEWQPATGLSCTDCLTPTATVEASQTYMLTVYDNLGGCADSDQISIVLNLSKDIFVPNAFTPNGDNLNDELQVFGSNIADMHLQIFDRWGQLVFESKNTDAVWDGTYRGKPLNAAVFTYTLDVHFGDGTQQLLQGNITLIR
ncbi:MAG: gliding motility-associated C-terminal domain-containing protein [Sphingobacteriales bacterium]|nr:gliding motility-associated C-terminal domain-containing protein [Sphingobacteriales bacterium]